MHPYDQMLSAEWEHRCAEEEEEMKYAVMGPGMSGATNDLDEAHVWLRTNPDATLYHAGAPIAADLRALTRDIHFWDFNNPRFGLTSEQAEEVIRCLTVVADRLDGQAEEGDEAEDQDLADETAQERRWRVE